MKDYYKILDLPPNASEEQIRKSYRRLALKYHPDRNPGNTAAETRFKEIAEAYGVLMDATKRTQYDRYRTTGGRRQTAGGFRYSQEEIFRDLFRDPRFNQIFREFERAGFRFDQRFFEQTFFGGRGGMFGGVFVWTPFGGPARGRTHRPPERATAGDRPAGEFQPLHFFKRLGQKISHYLLGESKALPGVDRDLDLSYDLTVSPAAASQGGWVQIAIPRATGRETLKVRIPPHIESGTRLRLKGKGQRQDSATGDLYLTIHLA